MAAEAATNVVTLLEIANRVWTQRSGSQEWDKAYAGQLLRPGDRGRTDENSRATLRLYDFSVMRVGENSLFEIVPPPAPAQKDTLTLWNGILYFFSRDKPVEANIRTPTVNASIRGTEFVLQQDERGRTVLTLLDGEVLLSNLEGQSITLTNREQGIFEPGKPPMKTAVIEAAHIIQWCLYYPAVLDLAELPLDPQAEVDLRESLVAYRSGDLLQALARYPEDREPESKFEQVYLASLLLAVGQVEAARNLLEPVASGGGLDERPPALARALLRLIATVKLQAIAPDGADSSPALATEWLVESYQRQSRARLADALAAARRAAGISPYWGFAWARVGELEFSFGNTPAAKDALETALQLAPCNAQALSLNGYLLAAQYRTAEAITWFDRAIAIDGALGNAWLGRGLCRIRKGDREGGRADLQTAAVLEPNRSFLRSYLGKAWSETREDALAGRELDLAKQLDPGDPTPWLYSALLDRDLNQLNSAVNQLEHSVALNTNRQVYRSQFLLDEDLAVRSSSLARIYQDADMAEVGMREAARAVNSDYANYSAHLFLSESYNALRDPTRFSLRYESVWLNELLLANLLAPVGAGTFSQNISQQEYARLFERDRLGLSTRTDYRSDGQWRETATQFGQHGRFGYALDVDYQHNDGVRVNNEIDRIEWYSTLKYQLSGRDTLLLRTKVLDSHSGDKYPYYDPGDAHPTFSSDNEQSPLVALGWHHNWSPASHTLALAGRLENHGLVTGQDMNHWLLLGTRTNFIRQIHVGDADLEYRSSLEIWFGELNQIWRAGSHTVIAGGRVQTGSFCTSTEMTDFDTNITEIPYLGGAFEDGFNRFSVYFYDQIALWPDMTFTAGVAYDSVERPANLYDSVATGGELQRSEVLPKAALLWTLVPGATLRGMYAWSLNGASFDESYRLEPTQLAGFVQSFRSVIPESVTGSGAGQLVKTWGGALDLKLASKTYLGLEANGWDCDVQRGRGSVFHNIFMDEMAILGFEEQLDYSAWTAGASLHQLIGSQWTAGVGWRWQDAKLRRTTPGLPDIFPEYDLMPGPQEATSNELWARLQWQHPAGPFVRADALWIWQSHYAEVTRQPDPLILEGNEFVSQINVEAGWRFRHGFGELACGILNVSGEDYRLALLSGYPELPRERVFFIRLQLNL